jgi:hypothetical protein
MIARELFGFHVAKLIGAKVAVAKNDPRGRQPDIIFNTLLIRDGELWDLPRHCALALSLQQY